MTPEEQQRALEVLAGQMQAMGELLASMRNQLGAVLLSQPTGPVTVGLSKAEPIRLYNGMEIK